MARISVLLFVLVACFATAMQAQAPAPKPDPELKKLHVWVGHWTYEEEDKPGPLGPGGKITGEYDGQMILGGFFFQGRWKGAKGETIALEMGGYYPVNKNFASDVYWDDGTRLLGAVTVSGNTFTWEGKCATGGKQYLLKGHRLLAADFMGFTETFEISTDGKTWAPAWEGKYTKVKPAPKK